MDAASRHDFNTFINLISVKKMKPREESVRNNALVRVGPRKMILETNSEH